MLACGVVGICPKMSRAYFQHTLLWLAIQGNKVELWLSDKHSWGAGEGWTNHSTIWISSLVRILQPLIIICLSCSSEIAFYCLMRNGNNGWWCLFTAQITETAFKDIRIKLAKSNTSPSVIERGLIKVWLGKFFLFPLAYCLSVSILHRVCFQLVHPGHNRYFSHRSSGLCWFLLATSLLYWVRHHQVFFWISEMALLAANRNKLNSKTSLQE